MCAAYSKSSTFHSVVVYSDSDADIGEWKAKLVTVCTIKLVEHLMRLEPFFLLDRIGLVELFIGFGEVDDTFDKAYGMQYRDNEERDN